MIRENIRAWRQNLATRLFAVYDRIEAAAQRLRDQERQWLNRIPGPSDAVFTFGGVFAKLAFAVDDPCPVCETSPCACHLRIPVTEDEVHAAEQAGIEDLNLPSGLRWEEDPESDFDNKP